MVNDQYQDEDATTLPSLFAHYPQQLIIWGRSRSHRMYQYTDGSLLLRSVLGIGIFLVLSCATSAFSWERKTDSYRMFPLANDHSRSEILADVWVTVEGSVPFGEDTTLGDAQRRSRDHARRAAVQQAVGTFVQSQSIVYNFQLAEDLIQTTVRGLVVEERILAEGAQSVGLPGDRTGLMYVTKLQARVKPIHSEHKGDLAVKVSLNKSIFTDGEEMEIRTSVNRDVYLHIFSIGQDDSVTVIFPNKHVKAALIPAHKDFIFPSELHKASGIGLRVFSAKTSQAGIERIKVIATTKKIDLIKGKFPEGIFRVYSGRDTRLITELLKELAMLDERDWAEATVVYEVREK